MIQIEKIEIKNHLVFKQQEIKFKSFNSSNNIFTVIIGHNGCGKSELLRVITDSVNSKIIEKESSGQIKIKTTGNVIFKNNEIPVKILASSFSLNDKFPILTKRNKLYHKNYEYLGLRSTTNNAFVGKYKKDFLTRLVSIISDEKKSHTFRDALLNIGMPLKFKFSFKYGRGLKQIMNQSSDFESYDEFNDKISKFISIKKNTNRLDSEKLYERLHSTHLKSEIFNFFKSKRRGLNSIEYRIDLFNQSLNDIFLHDASILIFFIESGIIQIDDFSFTTNDDFSFSMASSGQHHLFTEILNLTSSVTDDSLILIDEPEISLHPNWQIKYIELLQSIMNNYKGCHTIICSHSHFLVSCINEEYCGIMQAKTTKNGHIEITEYNQNVYGWSPEQVLYNVFGLSTTRNHYFESDIKQIISVISKVNNNINDIYEPLARVKRFNITDDDPLKILIVKADELIMEAGHVQP